MRLYCLGDSLTWGEGVHRSQVWTGLLAAESGWEVINCGVSGDTTGGMLVRLQPILGSVKQDPAESTVLLLGGSSDILYSGTDQTARANLGAMVQQLLAAGVLPLVGLPLPIDSANAPKTLRSVLDFENAAWVQQDYLNWTRKFCCALGVPVIDFASLFVDGSGELRHDLLLDGLYPNPEGHQKMAALLKKTLL